MKKARKSKPSSSYNSKIIFSFLLFAFLLIATLYIANLSKKNVLYKEASAANSSLGVALIEEVLWGEPTYIYPSDPAWWKGSTRGTPLWGTKHNDQYHETLTETKVMSSGKGKNKVTSTTDGYALEHVYTFSTPCCAYAGSQLSLYLNAWTQDIQGDDQIIVEYKTNNSDWTPIYTIKETENTDPHTYSALNYWDTTKLLIPLPMVKLPSNEAEVEAFYVRLRDTNRSSSDTQPGKVYVTLIRPYTEQVR